MCEEEGLESEVRTGCRVVEVRWCERGVWEVKVEELRTGMVVDDYYHFLLDALGILKCV